MPKTLSLMDRLQRIADREPGTGSSIRVPASGRIKELPIASKREAAAAAKLLAQLKADPVYAARLQALADSHR